MNGISRSVGNYWGYSIWEMNVFGDISAPVVYDLTITPLYDEFTILEPEQQKDTPEALVTRFADRARDRHAREDQFQACDHYLSFYWEHRTAAVEIVDPIGRGGDTITFNVTTQWRLSPIEAKLRFFYRGINNVTEYHNNGVMTSLGNNQYTRCVSFNNKINAPLQVGDRLEFELSQFLSGVPNGRNNYYGTAFLYIVGQGLVPWEARGAFGVPGTELEDSYPIAPQLVGLGLLEAIDESDIEALADPADADGDGISGRMRRVSDPLNAQTRLGRFGWKASQATVRNQVAAALNTDVGVMTSVFPSPDCGASQDGCGTSGVELGDAYLDRLTAYISLPGVRARRDLTDTVALQGEALFRDAGCNSCHVESLQTSPYHPHAELRDQTIMPYTDLLLHDMGPGLATTLAEFDVEGAEWRTPPLWGIGLTSGVSGGEAYLHDGRARTLTEAILWHGGECENARQFFVAMSQTEKDALLAFLNTL